MEVSPLLFFHFTIWIPLSKRLGFGKFSGSIFGNFLASFVRFLVFLP